MDFPVALAEEPLPSPALIPAGLQPEDGIGLRLRRFRPDRAIPTHGERFRAAALGLVLNPVAVG